MAGQSPLLRREVIKIYKNLLHQGHTYPLGYEYFRKRLHAAFWKNKDLADENAIREGIKRAEFVSKEVEALWSLKKYRTMRKRYGGH